jgi:pSer/pThr/pTyr-binding forkhead associated (FHA) protein
MSFPVFRSRASGEWHGGTYVNGARVSQHELSGGDIIAIGRATFDHQVARAY